MFVKAQFHNFVVKQLIFFIFFSAFLSLYLCHFISLALSLSLSPTGSCLSIDTHPVAMSYILSEWEASPSKTLATQNSWPNLSDTQNHTAILMSTERFSYATYWTSPSTSPLRVRRIEEFLHLWQQDVHPSLTASDELPCNSIKSHLYPSSLLEKICVHTAGSK